MSAAPVLAVAGLEIALPTANGLIPAVEDVSFTVAPGQTLGLVGESGAGKSLTALSILGLLPDARVSGSIKLGDRELTGLDERAFAQVRGRAVGMIFQEPRQSFNPAFTVGEQIAEPLRRHLRLGRREARLGAAELLRVVGIARSAERLDDYPHTFSGGMLQRAMIAMAIACRPSLLVADEPTTALDVTVQAQVLALLKRLQASMGMAMLFVSHDMGIIAEVCDEVIVMYAGQIIERGPVLAVFQRPRHPYTEGLLRSVASGTPTHSRLHSIPGAMPALGRPPRGCRFRPRCEHSIEACSGTPIELNSIENGQMARCLRASELSLHGSAA